MPKRKPTPFPRLVRAVWMCCAALVVNVIMSGCYGDYYNLYITANREISISSFLTAYFCIGCTGCGDFADLYLISHLLLAEFFFQLGDLT